MVRVCGVWRERCEIRRKTGVGKGKEEWEWKSEGWQEAGCEGRCLGLLVVGLVVVSGGRVDVFGVAPRIASEGNLVSPDNRGVGGAQQTSRLQVGL